MTYSEIEELITKTANAGLKLQDKDGSMPAGINGPHEHKMTPARNTGHWAITFLHAFKISKDERFRDSAEKCLNLLISPALRPMKGAFWHRCHIGRNSFNGLIGQSWSLEALYYGWKILELEKYRTIALEVFFQHVYDQEVGLWFQLDLDGSALFVEPTLNQQVWFAAMGAWLGNGEYSEILEMVSDFLSRLPDKFYFKGKRLFPVGVSPNKSLKSNLKNLVSGVFMQNRVFRSEVEHGYHLFTLCGLAHLYYQLPNHGFWTKDFFLKPLRHAFSAHFSSRLSNNRFGYPYNVPGFEFPFIYTVFYRFIQTKEAYNISNHCLITQVQNHYDFNACIMKLNTKDPETLAARFYEICRIPESYFSLDISARFKE